MTAVASGIRRSVAASVSTRLKTTSGAALISAVRAVSRFSESGIRIVCQPSLVESFGQATLEAMACARSVVATQNGGPPEFVTPEAGVLVDPLSTGAILEGLGVAAGMPSPNTAARAAAEPHGVDHQAERVEEVLRRVASRG